MNAKPEDLRGAAIWFAGTFFAIRDGEIEANPVSDSPRETFTPHEFRERLATLGRLPDKAEAGTDPAETGVGIRKPILLERLTREQCHQQSVDGIRTYLAEGRLVGLDGDNDDMSPATARIVAARLASLADLAEAENGTGSSAIDALARHLAEERGAGAPAVADWSTARTALQWMREREAQS